MYFIYSCIGAVSLGNRVSFQWVRFTNKEIEINSWLASSYVLTNEIKVRLSPSKKSSFRSQGI